MSHRVTAGAVSDWNRDVSRRIRVLRRNRWAPVRCRFDTVINLDEIILCVEWSVDRCVTSQRDVTWRPTSRRFQIAARISPRRRRRRRRKRRNVLNWRYRPRRLRLCRRRRRQKITSYRLAHERLVAFIVSIRRVGRGRLDEERSETSGRPPADQCYLRRDIIAQRPALLLHGELDGRDDVCLDVCLIW